MLFRLLFSVFAVSLLVSPAFATSAAKAVKRGSSPSHVSKGGSVNKSGFNAAKHSSKSSKVQEVKKRHVSVH